MAALGITERFERCICVVVSEETGTLSLANQGRLERPITSSRLLDLLKELIGSSSMGSGTGKSSLGNVSTLKPSQNNIDVNSPPPRGSVGSTSSSKKEALQ